MSRCSSVRSNSMAESLWKRFAPLTLQVDGYELERREKAVTRGFTRISTLVHLRGGGEEGVGEDVTWYAEHHDREQAAGAVLPLVGSWTLGSFSESLVMPAPARRGAAVWGRVEGRAAVRGEDRGPMAEDARRNDCRGPSPPRRRRGPCGAG